MSEDASPTRATLKDTYDLVDRTRQEVNERIDTLGSKMDEFVTSNEHRMTVLETHSAAQAQEITDMRREREEDRKDIIWLKDQQREDEVLNKARGARWSIRERVLTAVFSAAIAIGAILALLHV